MNSQVRELWPMFKIKTTQIHGSPSETKQFQILRNQLQTITDDDIGAWNELKKKLKRRFPLLTDEDLFYIEGAEEELLGRILKKVGREHLEDIFRLFLKFT